MPLVADRVKETTTTAGTGPLTLAGATTGYQSFSAAFGNGVSVYYVIAGGADWEVGIGTTGAGTLTRDTVLASSNANALVPLAAGTKDVFCAYVAGRAVTTVDAATLTNKTIDDYTNNVGANSTHFRIKAGATLAKGDVVKAVGFTPGEQAIEVVKVASAADVAIGICEQALNTGNFGTAVVIGELFNVNTNGFTVGDTLYNNGAGGYTATKPSSGLYQVLGWVVRVNASNGVIAVNVVSPLYVETSSNTVNTAVLRDGSGNFSAGTITAALTGNASTATTATQVANALTAGTYLTSGGTFTGAAARTFAVDATEASTASKVVARNASGQAAVKGLLVDGTSSGTVTVQGAAAAGTWSLTLPTSGGTNGQVLTTNGSGTTSWAAASSSVTVTDQSTTAANYYLVLVPGIGTNATVGVDTGLYFNPSTNLLTTPGAIFANGQLTMNNSIQFNVDATYNIGGPSTGRPNNVYVAGSLLAPNADFSFKTLQQQGSNTNFIRATNFQDSQVIRAQLIDYSETYATASISAGTLTLDLQNSNIFRVTRNANITTLSITNPIASGSAHSFTLIFDANGTSYTITWPAAVKWPGGTAPTITTTNGRSDMFVFYTNNAGTTWYAMAAAQNFVTT